MQPTDLLSLHGDAMLDLYRLADADDRAALKALLQIAERRDLIAASDQQLAIEAPGATPPVQPAEHCRHRNARREEP